MKASIYFDGRKIIKTGSDAGRSHIKILVEFDGDKRVRRYYRTEIFADREEFKKIITGTYGRSSKSESDLLDKKRTELLKLEAKAKSEIREGMTPDLFEQRFLSKGSQNNPLDMLLAYADELEQDGQIGTAAFYRTAHSGFKRFSGGHLSFLQVTPKFLLRYQNWLLEEQRDAEGKVTRTPRSISTVGTHVRPMRTIFKKAIDSGIIPPSMYPFGRNKYKCPSSKGRKIALDTVSKNKVLEYKGINQEAVDMWKFSYFCQGMNFNDIARLKRKNIVDGVLTFERQKTKGMTADRTPIVITMHDEAIAIIHRWGAKDWSPDAYVFSVLTPDLSPKRIKAVIKDWIDKTNDALALVSTELKLPKITTYWARHTFATVLKRNNVSIDYIQEALGHSSPSTTKAYLDSFDLDTKREMNKYL